MKPARKLILAALAIVPMSAYALQPMPPVPPAPPAPPAAPAAHIPGIPPVPAMPAMPAMPPAPPAPPAPPPFPDVPQQAHDACRAKQNGASMSYTTADGWVLTGTCSGATFKAHSASNSTSTIKHSH
ncbi:MAG TPA: hypothetical protein VIT92_07055 [Burkholderiaceae bacterium]